jgi:hypothetical protein
MSNDSATKCPQFAKAVVRYVALCRLTNRCTGRRAASVPLLAIGLYSYRQEAGQPLGASEHKR